MVNKKRLLHLTRQLIAIPSENPSGDEFRIARFVRRYLHGIGITSKIYEFKSRRSNVVACIPGKNTKHELLITPHLDTVPAGKGWHHDPFQATIRRGKLFGLGTTDCKGNLAAALEAMRSLQEEKARLDYTLIFAATANEESGSDFGLTTLLDKGILKPKAAVVLDADDFEIVVTQKGLMHCKLKIQGRRAHGAYPWLGVNAIEQAVNILRGLQAERYPFTKSRYLKGPTMNIGTIHGGDKVNIVADWCEVELDFRFLPGTDAHELLRRIRAVTHKYSKGCTIEIDGVQKPYVISEGHPLVTSLAAAMKKTGVHSQIKGSEGATVITFFQDKGIPAIATGCGSEGCAHAVDEYVTVANLYNGARMLEEFLRTYTAP